MATFATLQSKVSSRLLDPSGVAVSPASVADAINDAQHFWKYRRFWFNEAVATLTLDVNDPYVLGYGNTNASYPLAPVLPSDFLYETPENGFVIRYSNLSYTLKKVPPRDYDDANVSGVGIPSIYTFRDGNYEIYYYPNVAYSMNVYYIQDYADLVNTTDSNDFTNYADRLLVYEALSRLTGELRQDTAMAALYAERAQREYESLKTRGFQQTATGELSVETIL